MEDDLYPNDSSYFVSREPKDQNIARKKEKANVLEALPIIKEILERLTERIAFYENVRSIPDEVRLDPNAFLIMHNSNTLIAENLSNEKEYLEALLEEHASNR